MKNHNLQIIFLIIAISAAALFFSANQSYNINDRALVHAIGIDYDKDSDKYKISLQIFKPQGAGSDTPIDPSKTNMQLIKADGKNVSDALNHCQYEYGRELFMGHLQIIAFGDTVDFSNPEELFSFAIYNKNVYLGVKLCLADKSAEELLKTEITRGTMTSEVFTQTIDMNDRYSATVNCRLLDFLSCINTHQYIAIPVLSVKQPDKEESSQKEEENGNKSDPEIQIKETAIIKNGKILSDRLTNEEAIGTNWLTNKARSSKIIIDMDGEKVYALITKDSSKIKLTNEDGKLIYNVKLNIVAHPSKDIADKETKKRFAHLTEEKIIDFCKKSEKKALRDNSADIFGIWKKLRHSYPNGYIEYQNRLDEIYDSVEFNVNVDCRVA